MSNSPILNPLVAKQIAKKLTGNLTIEISMLPAAMIAEQMNVPFPHLEALVRMEKVRQEKQYYSAKDVLEVIQLVASTQEAMKLKAA